MRPPRAFRFGLSLVLTLVSVLTHAQEVTERPFWTQREDGWHWYKDERPKPPIKSMPAVTRPSTAAPSGPRHLTPQDLKDLEAFSLLKKQVEDYHNIAVINPSPENTKRAMEFRFRTLNVANEFDERSRDIALTSPQFTFDGDPNFRPANPVAQDTFDRETKNTQERKVRELAKTHGLFFFFRGDCPYCSAYAPYLRNFAAKYGLTVFAISLDGGQLPAFPNAPRDNGMASRLAAQLGIPLDQFRVPATFLAQPPDMQSVLPLGFGVMNELDLLDHIDQLTRQRVAKR
jgi:conjugal transfer pilus assembly protein TraF